jgi:hypothetical protein
MIDRQSFATKEGMTTAQTFRAQAGDVFVSTFPKTGTTLLQQVIHQLRTGGRIDFEEITEEVPWLEVGPSVGLDINLPQAASPRCFKSHQLLSALAHLEENGAKFVCAMRDPEKTLLSHFKFMLSHGHPSTASRDINVFIKSSFTLGPDGEGELLPQFGGTLWDHYVEYWQCRLLPNVKVVSFEQLSGDLESHLDGLNSFLGLPPLDDKLRTVALEHCQKDWMQTHSRLFDDHTLAARINAIMKKSFASVSKVNHDTSGEDAVTELSDESRAVLARMWKEKVWPVTGHASYTEMANGLATQHEGLASLAALDF